MTKDQKEALEVIIAATIASIFGIIALVIIKAVWGFEEPTYPTGTCRDAESLQEIPCGKYTTGH